VHLARSLLYHPFLSIFLFFFFFAHWILTTSGPFIYACVKPALFSIIGPYMSESPHEDDAGGTATKTEEVKGSGEIHAENHTEALMEGDIGNPPRVNFTQISRDKEEKEKKEPSPTTTSPQPLPSSPPTPVGPVDDMEARRDSSPIPPPSSQDDDSMDSESTNSTIDTSPAPSKRTMVMSSREHEETDDFLLSTMLAIRTAVCRLPPLSFHPSSLFYYIHLSLCFYFLCIVHLFP
jgi:hypothetical protein